MRSETKIENDLELERMAKLASDSKFNLRPYKGKTNDLDLQLTWYCPHCLTELKRNKEVLFCTSHPERCEYDFSNKAHRIETNTWWSEGYQYPLDAKGLHLTLIKKEEERIQSHKNNIALYQRKLAESEARLKALKSTN